MAIKKFLNPSMHMKKTILFILLIIIMTNCYVPKKEESNISSIANDPVSQTPFGNFNGRDVFKYKLVNRSMEVHVINYGGIITSIKTKDRNGSTADVVLGYDSLAQYVRANPYFG